MGITTIQPADPAAMQRLRDNWQREVDQLEGDLRHALQEARRISAQGVRIAHLIDELREKIDQRNANLAKYRP